MKKLRLSIQITLVFLAAFILTSALVVFSVTRSVQSIYEDIVYQKLEAEAKAIAQASDAEAFQHEAGLAVIQFSSEKKTYLSTENISDYANTEAVQQLVGKAALQQTNSVRYINTINGKTIYYIIVKYHGFFDVRQHDVYIILTDDTLINSMKQDMQRQVLLIFLFSFSVGYLVVLHWIFLLARETRLVAESLRDIGSNYYQTRLTTRRKDEIGDLVQSIEAMREKIVTNEKQKQEIIQGVSHDLRTPIAIMRSHAEALKDGFCTPDEVAEVVESECLRLDRQVTELLNTTRLNYIDLNPESLGKIRMDLLIEDVVKRYRHMTKAELVVDLKPESFMGDREAWRVLLQSLLDNAIRYAEAQIEITLKKDYLSVTNDGPRIEEERLPNIFKAFEKSATGNFGLGLSIVQRTAELFGYTAEVRNTKSGVCFEIEKE